MLFIETVSPALLNIIKSISADDSFRDFRLVGGTALSLQLGHRLSVDADFFTNQTFETGQKERMLELLLPGFRVLKISPHGVAGFYENVKIDLYTWHVPFLLSPIEKEGIRMADLPDLAALKLEAIINRKEEKDFRDIHALLGIFSLAELLIFYQQRIVGRDSRLVVDHLAAAPAADRLEPMTLLKSIPYETVSREILEKINDHLAQVKAEKERMAEDRLRQRIEALKKGRDDLPA
jgi:hypothetical protein